MIKYFLINEKRLVKGDVDETGLVGDSFEYIDSEWQGLDENEINDRLMGYDPFDDGFHGIGNTDIMLTIKKISEEAKKFQNK